MGHTVDRRWMGMESPRTSTDAASRPLRPSRLTTLPALRAGAAPGTVLAAGAVVAIGLLVPALTGHAWLAGLTALVIVAAAVAAVGLPRVRTVRPGRVAAPQRTIAAARAERRTEAAVKALAESGWHFLHDVRGRDTTYDHVAVGHGGVILLQSIDPQGTVTMQDGEPFVQRRDDPGAEPIVTRLRPRALGDAGALREDVGRFAGRRLWVQAVVVFWSEFPAGCVTDGRCVYVHGSRLADWLTRRPRQLSPMEVDDVFAAVSVLAEHGSDLPLPLAV